jgi:RND family efflux transporter MFP subunit
MANIDIPQIISSIRRLAADAGGLSDAHLLERFVANRDQTAFELLVRRHAPLVFGICRRILQDFQDAEDAFQATFLTLARRADRITKRAVVASWLYKVAYRVALTARDDRARRLSHERPLIPGEDVARNADATAVQEHEELRATLDREVSRLPEHFQAAVILCYLEGKTVDEAAIQLGCPRGTVASRLARARKRLRAQLEGCGLAIASVMTIAPETGNAAQLSLISSLISAAVHPGTATGAAISPRVAALSQEVLKAMFLHKLWTGTVLLAGCIGILLAGTGLSFSLYAIARAGAAPAAVEPQQQQTAERQIRAENKPADKAMPTLVTITHPVQRNFTPHPVFVGRLEPLQVVDVKARVNGELLRVYFKSGSDVKQGDLLFEIDPRDIRLVLDKAEANRRQAAVKKKQAAADLKRYQSLRETTPGSVTQEYLDKAVADVEIADAALQAAEADLGRAQLSLEFTKVIAPISGRIGEPLVTPGNQVSGAPGSATLLASIKTLDPIGVSFDMDERSFLEYQRLSRNHEVTPTGTPLFINLADESAFTRKGTLDSLSDHVDPATGTVRVRGRLPNPGLDLVPGLFTRVRIPFGRARSALAVPEEAIRADQGKQFVLVVNGRNQIEKREIVAGPQDDELRIIVKGLDPGDRVVVSNIARLHEGETVDPRRKTTPGQAGTGKK